MGRLRIVLLSATLLGMLACPALWLGERGYPLLPVAAWFWTPPSPWDKVFLGLVLASLVAAVRFYRPAALLFLAATAYLYLADQNRGQPWLYLYWVMLLVLLLPGDGALPACRFILSAVYFWAGLQKCHPSYFKIVPSWFTSPAAAWGWPQGIIQALEWLVAAGPALEIFIGLGVWLPRCRRAALLTALGVHGGALLFLGPLGHSYNLVVWPWNLAMPALLFVLFPASPPASFRSAALALREAKPALTVVLLVWLLPVLSYFGWWDSYFSFSLYSANLATADVYLQESFRERLPQPLQRFVHPVDPPYNPQLQGPLVFDHQGWAMAELGVPPLPEPRAYQAMFRHLSAHSTNANSLHMIVVPRRGPIMFHRMDGSWPVQGLGDRRWPE